MDRNYVRNDIEDVAVDAHFDYASALYTQAGGTLPLTAIGTLITIATPVDLRRRRISCLARLGSGGATDFYQLQICAWRNNKKVFTLPIDQQPALGRASFPNFVPVGATGYPGADQMQMRHDTSANYLVPSPLEAYIRAERFSIEHLASRIVNTGATLTLYLAVLSDLP
jgi:hypothetical protein